MDGPRRGRVRFLLPVVEEWDVVPRGGGGRGSRGGRGSQGGRGSRVGPLQSPNKRLGRSTTNEPFNLIIRDASSMPVGEGLETPLHPKRMRTWHIPSPYPPVPTPTEITTARTTTPPQSPTPDTPPTEFMRCDQSAPSTPSRSPMMKKEPAPSTPSCSPMVKEESTPSSPSSSPMVQLELIPRISFASPRAQKKSAPRKKSASPRVQKKSTPRTKSASQRVQKKSTPKTKSASPRGVQKKSAPKTKSASPRVQKKSAPRTPSASPMVQKESDPSTPSSSPMMQKESALSTPSASPMMQKESAPSTPSASPMVQKESAPSTPFASPMVQKESAPSKSFASPREHIPFEFNYGSEGSSDESDDEVPPSFIPRVFKSMLDTPMEDNVAEPPVSASTSAAEVNVDSAETYQPTSFYQFDWKTFPDPPIPPELRRETFSESHGPTIPFVEPYDIFVAIWDRQFMEYIASETNRYVQQVAEKMMANNSLRPNSRISQWYDTTADELYVYFGIIIAMGVVVKSRLDEYWNASADIFCTPGFGAHMSVNRFHLLNKFLHFNNNNDMRASELTASEARLYKIEPVLSHLNHKFQSIYKLPQNLALDESLLQWKGWLDINQLVPNKTAVMGIKSYEICESQTGYLWRFEIHAHKRSPQQQTQDPLDASTPSIVLRLTHGLENKGHTLWMDNFYNSPSLARHLKARGIDCVGTLRTNRQFVPQALQELTKMNMRKGEITGLTSGDVDVMVWRDNNRVGMISTYHGNAVKQVRESIKPILILDYNIMMGGVDKKDQMLSMYPIERKRTKVWYKKLFRRLLNVSILNSYVIHRHSSSLTHRNFRINLVKSLLSKHISSTPPLRFSPLVVQKGPLNLDHRLAKLPMDQNGYRKRRLCKVCRKRVHTFCFGCKKSVCLDPCFVTLHSTNPK